MTRLTRHRPLLTTSALLVALLCSPPLLAQAPASLPASAASQMQAPEPPAAASATPGVPGTQGTPGTPGTPGTWQGLRYGAGYQARQSLNASPPQRAPQAPAQRHGRGRGR